MSDKLKLFRIEQLIDQLAEKRELYNQMLSTDKEFEEVKTIFMQIRELEKSINEEKSDQAVS